MSARASPSGAGVDCDVLNTRLGLPELQFRVGPGGLAFAHFESPLASAVLCLQGAQLLQWRPRAQREPVIWLSAAARYEPGRPIRGGIPVCWPWFGAGPASGLPSHGFARTLPWCAQASGHTRAGAPWLELRLDDDECTRALWPARFRLELRVCVGSELQLELRTRNLGQAPLRIGEALHAYFRVGDIGALQLEGLDGRTYYDALADAAAQRQRGAVRCAQELDRVYADPGPVCAIVDHQLARRIVVAKSGSESTIVWNPWSVKAARLGDIGADALGPDAWRRMLCVESGNAREHALELAPGLVHALGVRYRVEDLS